MSIFTQPAVEQESRELSRKPEEVFIPGIMDPLQKYIKSNVSLENKRNLVKTCSFFYNVFFPDVKKEELLGSVIFGEQARAEALLKKARNDEEKLTLLLYGKAKNTVKDLSGKPIKGLTAFQAALCAGDVAIHKDNPQMCEMFQPYFEKIPNGLEEMHKQIEEIFPEGFPEDEDTDPPHIVKQKEKAQTYRNEILTPLINAIIAADLNQVNNMLENKRDDSPLGGAFETFRAKVEKINVNNLVCNDYYLLETFNLYNEHFEALGSWKKRDLFCIQVTGFIQSFLSACGLLALKQGICDIILDSEPLIRTPFKFKYALNNISEGSVRDISYLYGGLGFDHWIWPGLWGGRVLPGAGLEGSAPSLEFQKFCQAKKSALASLYRSVQQPAPMTALAP